VNASAAIGRRLNRAALAQRRRLAAAINPLLAEASA